MKLDVLENNASSLRLRIEGVSHNFVNALRRKVINGVECFAIDKVTVYENTGPMFDEYVAHRVGLVPIHMPEGYGEGDEVLFTLEGEGPITLYSRDMKTSDKKVKVANENIPIIKLAQDQKIRLDGKAVVGTGMKGSKFQPALATYKELDKAGNFEFYIESFGQMGPKEILHKAIETMKEEMKAINKVLKK